MLHPRYYHSSLHGAPSRKAIMVYPPKSFSAFVSLLVELYTCCFNTQWLSNIFWSLAISAFLRSQLILAVRLISRLCFALSRIRRGTSVVSSHRVFRVVGCFVNSQLIHYSVHHSKCLSSVAYTVFPCCILFLLPHAPPFISPPTMPAFRTISRIVERKISRPKWCFICIQTDLQ